MAYKTSDLKIKAEKAIKDNGLYFIEDLVAYLPCSKPTFYEHFPINSDGYNQITDLMSENGVNNIIKKNRNKVTSSKKKKGCGYVYVIKCKGFDLYKIGISKIDVPNRLSNLQSGNPFELEVVRVFYSNHYSLLEHEIHERYSKYRVRGEWFEFNDAELLCVLSELTEQSNKQLRLF